MNFKTLATAAALSAAAVGAQAQALTFIDLGTLDNVSTPIGAFKSAPGGYVDVYDFIIGAAGSAAGAAVGVELDSPFSPGVEFNFSVLGVAFADASYQVLSLDVDPTGGYSVLANLPTAGAYKFLVIGAATGTQGGSYGGVLQTVTAVPEPETYAMMLAGLGALGFLARRRRRA